MGGKGSGRPGKPTAQHKLEGTYRGDRHDGRVDDAMYNGVPKRPTGLKGDALKLWNLLYPQFVKSGVATEVDAPAIESMCRWWALWRDQMRDIETGNVEDFGKASVVAARYHREFRIMAGKFGLSPADRLRFTTRVDEDGKQTPTGKFGIVG